LLDDELLLEIKGVSKVFPGVKALDNVDFSVKKGEVHVLVGENGAGKTTLVKIIVGAYIPDSLEAMKFEGKDVSFSGPEDSINVGIAAVYQQFSLVPDMTVVENIFLGREMQKGTMSVNHAGMNEEAIRLINDLGVKLNINLLVRDLSVEDQQIVEICKAISQNPKLLLMDEPTAGLKHEEIERLFNVIQKLKDKGVTILYISHRLEEIFEIGDRVTVLRNGKKVMEIPLKETNHDQLVKLIIGREIEDKFPKESIKTGETILRVENLANRKTKVPLSDISFELKESEILGIYGILGSGKDDLAHTLFGLNPATGGSIKIVGKKCRIKNPKGAIKSKMGYLTEDRRKDGLVMSMTVKENQTIAALERFCVMDHIIDSKEKAESDRYIKKLDIRTPHREFLVENLSGGNQQKVAISKWLISQAKVLILNEPTKGVDVGSKVEVFRLMVEQAKMKKGVLFITSELDEVAAMADRIIVMRGGHMVAEFQHGETSKDELLRLATLKDKTIGVIGGENYANS